ncbi:MAG: hypothetical protein E6Q68_06770 [Polynucleobacter sp.]|nr:MAG: hypothetical protein E6Q68_06770 [Polynucleobacter sp.]
MAAFIIAVVVMILIAIIIVAAKKAVFHADGTAKDIIRWTKYILVSDKATFTCYGLNKTNAALAAMFTMLSAVLLHSWFFVAAVMAVNGTHVEGMGWILVGLYTLGTLGCVAYSLGFGSHVMNRPMLPPASNAL